MDDFVSDCDYSSSSEIDSDLEATLYSQVHHEYNPDTSVPVTPNRKFSTEPFKVSPENSSTPCILSIEVPNSLAEMLVPIPRTCSNSTPLPKSEITIISSDDDCKILSDETCSKYSYVQKRKRKRQEIISIDLSSSDSESEDNHNMYIHLNGNENKKLKKDVEIINIDSDVDLVLNQEIQRNYGLQSSSKAPLIENGTQQNKEIGNVDSSFSNLSTYEKLEKEMHNYYNNYTENDLCRLTPKEIISSLKGVEWYVAASDRKRKLTSKSAKKLYRLKCRNCNERGHFAESCPKTKKFPSCHHCAGTHRPERCQKRCCLICWKPGHFASTCGEKKKIWKTQCTICKSYGHNSTFCSDWWRKYHLTTKPGPLVMSSTSLKPADEAYCSNCAKKGHFVHQCNKKLMDQFTITHRPDIVSYSQLLTTPEEGYCSNCAERGHFAHQCNKNQINQFTAIHRPDIASYRGLSATSEDSTKNAIPFKKKCGLKTKMRNWFGFRNKNEAWKSKVKKKKNSQGSNINQQNHFVFNKQHQFRKKFKNGQSNFKS